MVMGGDSHSEGRGFESRCHILDGHFFTLICCKIVLMFVEEAGLAHFFKKRFSIATSKICTSLHLRMLRQKGVINVIIKLDSLLLL